MSSQPLELRNPHSALAALKTRARDVLEVRLNSRRTGTAWDEVAEFARRHHVQVSFATPQAGSPHGGRGGRGKAHAKRGSQSETERTGAGTALVRERSETPLPDLIANATEKSADNKYGVWLALDQVQDPRNLGAIFRSAAFFGVRGIVSSRSRSAPISAVAYDTAAGGVEYVPFCQPANLASALKQAQKAGLWILGASEHATNDIRAVDRGRPWMLVLGNEQSGIRRLTSEHCDEHCKLAAAGEVQSLNVSVAAAVLMNELTR